MKKETREENLARQCPECAGSGEHIYDSCDHKNNHIQTTQVCEVCGGSGYKINH